MIWALKSHLNENFVVQLAKAGVKAPVLHPEPLPDWFPGFSGLSQEDTEVQEDTEAQEPVG
jgi:hypothetical protein